MTLNDLFSGGKIQELLESAELAEKCQTHNSIPVTYFCVDDSCQVAICDSCTEVEHKGHKIKDLQTVRKSHTSNLKQHGRVLESYINENEKLVEREMIRIQGRVDRTREKIEQEAENVKNFIDKIKAERLSELAKINDTIADIGGNVNAKLKKLADTRSQQDHVVPLGTVFDLQTIGDHFHSKASNLQQQTKRHLENLTEINLSFEKGSAFNKIHEILESEFGRVVPRGLPNFHNGLEKKRTLGSINLLSEIRIGNGSSIEVYGPCLYVASKQDGIKLYHLDDGRQINKWSIPEIGLGKWKATSIAALNDKVYVTYDNSEGIVSVHDLIGRVIELWRGIYTKNQVNITAKENCLVLSCPNESKVIVYSTDGRHQLTINDHLKTPVYALHSNQKFYVCDSSKSSILVYGPSGKHINNIPINCRPSSLLVNDQGMLMISDWQGHRILYLTSTRFVRSLINHSNHGIWAPAQILHIKPSKIIILEASRNVAKIFSYK